MLPKVMEDQRAWIHDSAARVNTMIRFGMKLIAVSCVCFATVPATYAQSGGSAKFDVKIVDVENDSRQIKVPLNRNVIIQTTVEVARADVVAGDLVSIQPISPKQLLVTGKAFGQTSIVLWDKSNQQYVLDVTVELDLDRLNSTFKEIDPLGSAQANSMMGRVVLTGTVSSAIHAKRIEDLAKLFVPITRQGGGGGASGGGGGGGGAAGGGAAAGGGGAGGSAGGSRGRSVRVLNYLQVAGEQQVLLKCTVAEVSRRATRELGINGFLAGDNLRDGFAVNQIGGINPINIGAAGGASVTGDIPFFTDQNGINIGSAATASLGFPRLQMQLFLRAMVDNQLAHILAEPNLVAISGETATFLAGGEFPIPVPQGNQQVTIEFREFGVRLNFTPLIRANQSIRLRVAPEVSELDFSSAIQIEGFVVPGLTTRATETTVELGSGQTIAIAGLLNERISGLQSQLPGIGELPVLGALFRSVSYQRSLSELVILVTPEIVAPLDAHQTVSLPTDGASDPSNFELYMLGIIEGEKRVDADGEESLSLHAMMKTQPEEKHLHGPWGYAASDDFQ